MLVCHSSINFLNLARFSGWSEKTFRRHFRKSFDFTQMNLQIIEQTTSTEPTCLAMDATFIKKSGKQTFGLGKFHNGSNSRIETGLECSLISLIDLEQNASLALDCKQTPPRFGDDKTRIDFYLKQVQAVVPKLPESINYGVFDGFYAKQKFVNGVLDLNLQVISKLRCDANLKHLYTGKQNPGRGRPRRFIGKVDFDDLSDFDEHQLENKRINLYSKVVWSVTLKRKIKLVIVKIGKRASNLFTTDLELETEKVFEFYRSRFQIEFLIRDAKQSAGLQDCQARDKKALEFHWNTAFTTVNLARWQSQQSSKQEKTKVFSIKSIKQQFFNEHLLKLFISKLDLELNLIKYQKPLEELRNYAVISP
jgi:hypothetical protein